MEKDSISLRSQIAQLVMHLEGAVTHTQAWNMTPGERSDYLKIIEEKHKAMVQASKRR